MCCKIYLAYEYRYVMSNRPFANLDVFNTPILEQYLFLQCKQRRQFTFLALFAPTMLAETSTYVFKHYFSQIQVFLEKAISNRFSYDFLLA